MTLSQEVPGMGIFSLGFSFFFFLFLWSSVLVLGLFCAEARPGARAENCGARP